MSKMANHEAKNQGVCWRGIELEAKSRDGQRFKGSELGRGSRDLDVPWIF